MSISNENERATLKRFVQDIHSPEYLKRAWIEGNMRESDFWFDWVVDFFLDDTHYAGCAEDHLGESLYDQQEVVAVRRMAAAIDTILKANRGRDLTDADYLRTPEWPAVHEAAKALHALIVANDAKMAAGEGGAP